MSRINVLTMPGNDKAEHVITKPGEYVLPQGDYVHGEIPLILFEKSATPSDFVIEQGSTMRPARHEQSAQHGIWFLCEGKVNMGFIEILPAHNAPPIGSLQFAHFSNSNSYSLRHPEVNGTYWTI